MKENKLIIAAAGSGKTTYLVEEAYKHKANVLITTFTNENEAEINKKFIEKYGCVPSHVTIQPWFSFLLQHGVRPYQGGCYQDLFEKWINGVLLVNDQSGVKYRYRKGGKEIPVYYSEETEFFKHYFTNDMRIYTDKIAKFVIRANEKTEGRVIDRISRIFPVIYIDEVQDLAGYDLDILKELFHSKSTVVCVGDPRQVTYHTHCERKRKQYNDGLVKQFILEECYKDDNVVIEETLLSRSHRNNLQICEFSSTIYPLMPQTFPCDCPECHPLAVEHQGVFIVKEGDVMRYLELYRPVQLRHSIRAHTHRGFSAYNYGQSKGATFN